MKPSLQPGISLVRRVLVEKEKTIAFMGEELTTKVVVKAKRV